MAQNTAHATVQRPAQPALDGIDAEIAAAAQAAAAHQSVPLELVQPEPAIREPWAGTRALAVTWLLCLVLTFFNIERGGLIFEPRVELEPAAVARGLRISAEMQAVAIEAYKAEHGVLPTTPDLAGLPVDDPALVYELVGNDGFRLTVRQGELEGAYDSNEMAQRRAAAEAQRAAEAERSAAEAEQWAAESEEWIANARQEAAETRRENLR